MTWSQMYQTVKAGSCFLTLTRWCSSLRKMVCLSLLLSFKVIVLFLILEGGVFLYELLLLLVQGGWWLINFFLLPGFTTPQAEVIVKVLMRMTTSSMDVIYCDMVTKVQQVRRNEINLIFFLLFNSILVKYLPEEGTLLPILCPVITQMNILLCGYF